jgi:hypothetical protein
LAAAYTRRAPGFMFAGQAPTYRCAATLAVLVTPSTASAVCVTESFEEAVQTSDAVLVGTIVEARSLSHRVGPHAYRGGGILVRIDVEEGGRPDPAESCLREIGRGDQGSRLTNVVEVLNGLPSVPLKTCLHNYGGERSIQLYLSYSTGDIQVVNVEPSCTTVSNGERTALLKTMLPLFH